MPQIARRPLADEIQDVLREAILSGQYQPGQRLTELETAREMGTSQGPVREAFAALTKEGLLVSLPHRGTFVATVSEAEARMAYALRARIEVLAFELALPNVSPQFTADLRHDIQAMNTAADAGDLFALMAADMRFHGRVYKLAGTEVLVATWALIESTIRKFILLAAPLYVADLHEAADHHIPLLRGLETHDLEFLRAEVPEHLTNLFKRMRLETGPEER